MTSICNFNHQNMFVCQQELLIEFAIQSFYLKFFLVQNLLFCPGFAKYSKVSFIRPSRSRLLEFEKKDSTGLLRETFYKIPVQI